MPNTPINARPAGMMNAADIKQTALTIQKIRPAYSPLMEFYARLFAAQADAAEKLSPAPIRITDDLLALKRENEMPLISPNQFPIDVEASTQLMKTFCDLAMAHAPKLAPAGQKLKAALDKTDALDLERVFDRLLDSQSIEDQARSIDLGVEELAFFGLNAITPSIQVCSAQLAAYLPSEDTHNKGYCPVCGSHPELAFLDETGKKRLTCSLCAHEWAVSRMGCLFCDAKEEKEQFYFFSEVEKEYRVYYCKVCSKYIKTIDTRELGRQFFPKLEQVATLHLDMKAQEQGLTQVGFTGS